MPERTRVAALLASGLLLLLAPLITVPAVAADTELRIEGAVRFVVEDGGVLAVDGQRRFLDTVELLPNGPILVNELPMEDYVAGVAEMPSRWAGEALKAQAVAARTYAWYSIGLGTFPDYDICASTACQVYRGADVVLDEGERWQAAVRATTGEVLVDDAGRPILARYFSTSGGRTYANEEVFPSSGPRDYLRPIDDPDDAVSPYHRWTVRFSREEFDEILGRGQRLAAATPVASVERLGPLDDQDAVLRVTGRDGTQVDLAAAELRDFLSRVAPNAYPERFPTARSDGLRPLPTTVPSTRFEVEVTDDEVVVDGRGWGHGVGMGQYGARGRAERGESYRSILAAYYGGLVPSIPAGLPERIRVGMDAGDEHTVTGSRPVTITDADGTVVVDGALGAWTATLDGGGWRLAPPPGTDAELEVTPTRAVDELFGVRDALTVEAEVNKPVVLRLVVRDTAGTVVVDRDLGTVDAGTHAATWRFVDHEGHGVPAGAYGVALVATDAAGSTAGTAMEVSVDEEQAEAASAADAPRGSSGGGGPPLLVIAAALALPLALIGVVLATRKASS